LRYRLKQRWRDGSTHVVFEPAELMEKLAALVPPPRFHLVRYHGILGPCASERDRIVPVRRSAPAAEATAEPSWEPGAKHRSTADAARIVFHEEIAAKQEDSPARAALGAGPIEPVGESAAAPATPALRARRLTWAELLRRVLAIDVLECPRCGGRLRLLVAIHSPDAQHAILDCLGLPSRAPPLAPAAENSIDADIDDQPDRTGTPDVDLGFDFGA
jgi:hypothetical protein